ncbi:MAG: cytochrome c oxidase accessory protein CcoG [Hyphomicrobiales bacterium]|nr:cytochrome c oxidase accessory protein CcoG [Hyphomicrobiales bacterium]
MAEGDLAAQTPVPGPAPTKKESLYADHVKIHSRSIKGTFRSLKWAALYVLLGLYYIGPFIRWDRGPGAPDQALLIDMTGRRAYFFMIEIWPQEVYYLTGLLILGAIGLFLVTALFGRVWCGFTCPQTVWTDLFIRVERLVEGDRNARIKLDKAPLSLNKIGRKLLKHGLWLLIAFATGGAWILYFGDAFEILGDFFVGGESPTVYGFTALFTGTTYVLAGWAREQVCIYMCPWPRFQSAMFDEHSMIVTYEEWRGEPRAKYKRGEDFSQRGDCVDCGLCVQVCPTGVDIRKGQQMACIGCALCVDACNSIMDRYKLPRGLITYDSISNQVAREKGEATKLRLIRPRTILYATVLAIVAAVLVVSLSSRSRLEINIQRDRAPLFVTLSDGDIRNGYTYKVLNMERAEKHYTLRTAGIPGATMHVIGVSPEGATQADLSVKPDTVGTFKVYVTVPRGNLQAKSTEMNFVLTDKETGDEHGHETVFIGPAR